MVKTSLLNIFRYAIYNDEAVHIVAAPTLITCIIRKKRRRPTVFIYIIGLVL